jgi:hypothetical protein
MRKCVSWWPVHHWITRAKHAVIMGISSFLLRQGTTLFSDGTGLVSRAGPPPECRSTNTALLKTRNRLHGKRVSAREAGQSGHDHSQICPLLHWALLQAPPDVPHEPSATGSHVPHNNVLEGKVIYELETAPNHQQAKNDYPARMGCLYRGQQKHSHCVDEEIYQGAVHLRSQEHLFCL